MKWYCCLVSATCLIATPAFAQIPNVAALKSKDSEVRTQTYLALCDAGPKAAAAVPALIALLGDPDLEVRGLAASVLGSVGKGVEATVPALIEATKQPDLGVRTRAIDALESLGPEAAAASPTLLKLVQTGDKDTRAAAIAALGKIKASEPEVIEALMAVAKKDVDPKTRGRAIRALGNIGGPAKEAVPFLGGLLKDRDVTLRGDAIWALGGIGPEAGEAAEALAAATKDPRIREYALEALGKLKGAAKPALPEMIKCLKSNDLRARKTAARALGEIGPEARSACSALIEVMESEHQPTDPKKRNRFTEATRERPSASGEAYSALYQIKPAADSVPKLVRLLRHRHKDLAEHAARLLGEMGSEAEDAMVALQEAAEDKDEDLRRGAIAAMRKIEEAE